MAGISPRKNVHHCISIRIKARRKLVAIAVLLEKILRNRKMKHKKMERFSSAAANPGVHKWLPAIAVANAPAMVSAEPDVVVESSSKL